MADSAQRLFARWDIHQRIQHFMLVAAMLVLMATGLPLRYPDVISSRIIVTLVGGIDNAGIAHRCAAVTMMLATLYHIVYLCVRWRQGNLRLTMMPAWKDVQDVIGMLLFLVGLSRVKPKFARYSFKEKSEYWAMMWGSVVMMGTGLMLWFPTKAALIFHSVSPIAFDVARIIHSYEALLAFLAIIIWHLYNAHLTPEFFPMSWTWLNGTITEDQLKAEHGLEYDEIIERERSPRSSTPAMTKRTRIRSRAERHR
jgi:formate dehydrogenase subunit gamma